MIKNFYFLLSALAVALVTACSGADNVAESTMADVAQTIPADARAIVVISDSLLKDARVTNNVNENHENEALAEALALCSAHPAAIVAFMTDDAEFLTWPLPSPAEAAEKTAKWDKASLNGAEDARACVFGNHTVVVSETQAWVVRGAKGAKSVNAALRLAQTASAASVPVLRNCITGKTLGASAVVRLDNVGGDDHFLALSANLGERSIDLAGNVRNADGSVFTLGDAKSVLDTKGIDNVVGGRAFVAFYAQRDMLTDAVRALADLAPDYKSRIALNTVAPMFDRVEGPVIVALGKGNVLEARFGFAGREDAEMFRADMASLSSKFGLRLEVSAEGDAVVIRRALGSFDFEVNIGAAGEGSRLMSAPYMGLAEGRVSAMGYDIDLHVALTTDGGAVRISTPTREEFDDIIEMLLDM